MEFLPIRLGILFGFFGFLRISNLAPRKVSDWDHTRHSSLQDVLASVHGLLFTLKWSKSRQHANHNAAIPLPQLGDSILCPLSTWLNYRAAIAPFQLSTPTPLLVSTTPPVGQPITIPQFRSAFHRLSALAGLIDADYTPHSLRRGGGYVFISGRRGHSTYQIARYVVI